MPTASTEAANVEDKKAPRARRPSPIHGREATMTMQTDRTIVVVSLRHTGVTTAAT